MSSGECRCYWCERLLDSSEGRARRVEVVAGGSRSVWRVTARRLGGTTRGASATQTAAEAPALPERHEAALRRDVVRPKARAAQVDERSGHRRFTGRIR